jgi:hypothetical protein
VAPGELAREAAEQVGMALSAELVLVAEPPGPGGEPAAVARWGAGDVPATAIAHAAPAAVLRRVVATALLCAGLLIAAQTLW